MRNHTHDYTLSEQKYQELFTNINCFIILKTLFTLSSNSESIFTFASVINFEPDLVFVNVKRFAMQLTVRGQNVEEKEVVKLNAGNSVPTDANSQ